MTGDCRRTVGGYLRAETGSVGGELFSGRAFAGIVLTGSVGNVLFCLTVFAVTLFFENVQGLSPLLAGAALLPMPAATSLSGPVSGRLTSRSGPRVSMLTGLLMSLVAFTVIGLIALAQSWPLLLLMLAIARLGMGMVYGTTDDAALDVVSPQKAGAASGITLTGLALSGAFGVNATAELIETFGGKARATLQSISSTSLVAAGIAVVTILLAITLIPKPQRPRVRRK